MKQLYKTCLTILIIAAITTLSYSEFQDFKRDYSTSLELKQPVNFKVNSIEKKEETALRRFEIIFLTTLPLTMFISFSLVQFYEMHQQKSTSPILSKNDLKFVLAFSFTSSTVIAVKDVIKWKKSKKKNAKKK